MKRCSLKVSNMALDSHHGDDIKCDLVIRITINRPVCTFYMCQFTLQSCFEKVINVIKKESMVLGASVGGMGFIEVNT